MFCILCDILYHWKPHDIQNLAGEAKFFSKNLLESGEVRGMLKRYRTLGSTRKLFCMCVSLYVILYSFFL